MRACLCGSQPQVNGSFLVAQNDAENEQEGLLWSRYDWVFNESIPAPFEWGFCTAAWNASTQQEAAEAIGVNYNDIYAGCFGFPFTFMKRDDEFAPRLSQGEIAGVVMGVLVSATLLGIGVFALWKPPAREAAASMSKRLLPGSQEAEQSVVGSEAASTEEGSSGEGGHDGTGAPELLYGKGGGITEEEEPEP